MRQVASVEHCTFCELAILFFLSSVTAIKCNFCISLFIVVTFYHFGGFLNHFETHSLEHSWMLNVEKQKRHIKTFQNGFYTFKASILTIWYPASLKWYWEINVFRIGLENSTFVYLCALPGLSSMRLHETTNLTRKIVYNVLEKPLTCKTNEINHNSHSKKWGTISWILNFIAVERVDVLFSSRLAFNNSCLFSLLIKFTGAILFKTTKKHIVLSISLYEKSFDAFMDSMIPLVADMPSDISYKTFVYSIWLTISRMRCRNSKPAEWNENEL